MDRGNFNCCYLLLLMTFVTIYIGAYKLCCGAYSILLVLKMSYVATLCTNLHANNIL